MRAASLPPAAPLPAPLPRTAASVAVPPRLPSPPHFRRPVIRWAVHEAGGLCRGPGAKLHSFVVRSPVRAYTFAADTAAELQRWVSTLAKLIPTATEGACRAEPCLGAL